MGSPETKKPAEWRAPQNEFSAWDDAKFTIGGALVLLSPLLIVAAIAAFVWLLL